MKKVPYFIKKLCYMLKMILHSIKNYKHYKMLILITSSLKIIITLPMFWQLLCLNNIRRIILKKY